jgi:hypothetical protein
MIVVDAEFLLGDKLQMLMANSSLSDLMIVSLIQIKRSVSYLLSITLIPN